MRWLLTQSHRVSREILVLRCNCLCDLVMDNAEDLSVLAVDPRVTLDLEAPGSCGGKSETVHVHDQVDSVLRSIAW